MLYTNCEVIQIKFTIYFFYREKCSLEIMRFFSQITCQKC